MGLYWVSFDKISTLQCSRCVLWVWLSDLTGSARLTDFKQISSITNHTSKGLSSLWLHLSFHSFQSLRGPRGTVSALWERQSTDHFLLKVIMKFTGLKRRVSPWKWVYNIDIHWQSTKLLQLKSAGVKLRDFVNSPRTALTQSRSIILGMSSPQIVQALFLKRHPWKHQPWPHFSLYCTSTDGS